MGKVDIKCQKWIEIKDREPPQYKKWVEEDEKKLEDLKNNEITMDQTELGCLHKTHYHELMNSSKALPSHKRKLLIEQLKKFEDEEQKEEPGPFREGETEDS